MAVFLSCVTQLICDWLLCLCCIWHNWVVLAVCDWSHWLQHVCYWSHWLQHVCYWSHWLQHVCWFTCCLWLITLITACLLIYMLFEIDHIDYSMFVDLHAVWDWSHWLQHVCWWSCRLRLITLITVCLLMCMLAIRSACCCNRSYLSWQCLRCTLHHGEVPAVVMNNIGDSVYVAHHVTVGHAVVVALTPVSYSSYHYGLHWPQGFHVVSHSTRASSVAVVISCIDYWLMIAYIVLFSALLSRLTALACGATWVTSFFIEYFWISTEVV